MSEVSKEDIIGEVGALLKRIDLKDDDFQRVYWKFYSIFKSPKHWI